MCWNTRTFSAASGKKLKHSFNLVKFYGLAIFLHLAFFLIIVSKIICDGLE